jgi:maltose alpha-D-glucosyltransferase/alpha-amylase
MRRMPPIPAQGQWASFLRNHDELDLGRLSAKERNEVYAAFGPEPEMQLYNRGIRRRLAPMLGGDERRIKMAHSLMFALPGTPVIWYGEEIGMGDDLSLPERNSVRTPMQWSDDANAGFSTSPANHLVRPVVSDGEFDYRRVNVRAQRDLEGSLLEHMQRLIRTRRSCPEVGWGECQVLEAGESSVLALRSEWQNGAVLTLHNLADRPATAKLPNKELIPLFSSDGMRDPLRPGASIEVEGYGFRWYRSGDP